jgi:hypothetical protein
VYDDEGLLIIQLSGFCGVCWGGGGGGISFEMTNEKRSDNMFRIPW